MEAPEKIYLQVCGDCNANDCKNCKFEDLEDNVTWCKDKIFDKDIEYTRTDAFIEKAKKWFECQNEWIDLDGVRHCDLEDFEDFVKFIKGE
jgi:hypothetical protein